MSFDHEITIAKRQLRVLEDGELEVPAIASLYEEADPCLVYFLFAWLRNRYAGNPIGDGVFGRMVGICKHSPKVARMAKEGEKDALVKWFEDTYDYGDFDRDEFVELVVEKLES